MIVALLGLGELNAQGTDCPCVEPGSIIIGDPANTDDPNSSVTYLSASPLGGLLNSTLTFGCISFFIFDLL